MSVQLLTEHHLDFLSTKRGCTGSSESALVKMPHFWKSNVVTHLIYTSLPRQFQDINLKKVINSTDKLRDHYVIAGTLKVTNLAIKKPKRKVYQYMYQKCDYESVR